MKVTYQDCGCIALPDEVVVALELSAGSSLNLSYDAGSKVISVNAIDVPDESGMPVSGASCRIRTDTR